MSVKGAQQFCGDDKKTILYKIPARPRGGRPLTGVALLSLVFGAERYGSIKHTEKYPSVGVFFGRNTGIFGNSDAPVPVIFLEILLCFR